MTDPERDEPGLVAMIHRLEGEIQALTRRLEDSERSHRRRVRRATAGLLLATALISAGGAAYLAQTFNRVDVIGPNNDVRVSMSVDPTTGSAGLEVIGLNGRRVIFLGTSQTGLPNLAIYDPTGQRIVREVGP